jgi:hypothetical protein
LNLSSGGFTADGRQAAGQILAAAGRNKPSLIFMTGELVEPQDTASPEPRRLQKPFRVSDVLAVLREVFSSAPAEKVGN